MSEFRIEVPAGQNRRLLTGGKYCPDDILIAGEHRAAAAEKDVNFWDYDGTLLYSYTLEEAQALCDLPAPPVPKHDFLTFTNWNWSLEYIKAYGKAVDVGAIYATADGSTHLFVGITSDSLKEMALYFIQTVSEGVTVDWGDGSAPETVSGIGTVTAAHRYAAKGYYIIRLSVTAGTVTLGWNDSTNSILGDDSSANRPVKACLEKAFIGHSTELGAYAFWSCCGMTEVTVPENIVFSSSPFNSCRSLRHLNLPDSLTAFTNQMCSNSTALRLLVPGIHIRSTSANAVLGCYSLRRGFILPSVSSLGYGTYYECLSNTRIELGAYTTSIGGSAMISNLNVTELTLPARVSSIAASAFSGMQGLRKLQFLPTAPPAVANANAFNGIPTDCVVEVPANALTAYQGATNYASLAAQMVGV